MFGWFNSKPRCAVPEKTRELLDDSFCWLIRRFGRERLLYQRVLTPTFSDFPVLEYGVPEAAGDIADIVCRQMEIDRETFVIGFFDEGPAKLNAGITDIYVDKTGGAAGYYTGRNSYGKLEVLVNKSELNEPVSLTGTIAHELGHAKLMGEGWYQGDEADNEIMTELITVYFGLGIFGANSAFTFGSNVMSWSYRVKGYFKQETWAYALALYAWINEDEQPEWLKHLNKTVQGDFKRTMRWFKENPPQLGEFAPRGIRVK